MNTKTLKALAMIALLAANLTHAAVVPPDGGTADYISPGIGTLVMSWLSLLR